MSQTPTPETLRAKVQELSKRVLFTPRGDEDVAFVRAALVEALDAGRAAADAWEASLRHQHHIFCNYWTGPIGAPGCVCEVVNKYEHAASEQARQRAIEAIVDEGDPEIGRPWLVGHVLGILRGDVAALAPDAPETPSLGDAMNEPVVGQPYVAPDAPTIIYATTLNDDEGISLGDEP